MGPRVVGKSSMAGAVIEPGDNSAWWLCRRYFEYSVYVSGVLEVRSASALVASREGGSGVAPINKWNRGLERGYGSRQKASNSRAPAEGKISFMQGLTAFLPMQSIRSS